MPLAHSKSKKAFKENLKTELNEGKPMKQSLAIAYGAKRKKKMAKGGHVSAEREKYSRGVNPNTDIKGMSNRGLELKYRTPDSRQNMKKEHLAVISEMEKIKPNIKGLAKGGHVSAEREKYSRGVNPSTNIKGVSNRGLISKYPMSKEEDRKDSLREHRAVMEEMKGISPKLKGLAYGGDVQDDVNEVFERDPIDHDSMSDSTHWGESKDRAMNEGSLDEYKSIGDDYPQKLALGGHVEMLVDKMLKMKMGNKEAEHFDDGGPVKPKPSPYAGLAEGAGLKHEDSSDESLEQKIRNVGKKMFPGTYSGYSSGGKIEQMVNACIDKKMMASGGQIVEDDRANDDEMDQSDEDVNSAHMNDDILSQDSYMNENMDHEDSMAPNKKKKNLMASILAEVRKHNMGK